MTDNITLKINKYREYSNLYPDNTYYKNKLNKYINLLNNNNYQKGGVIENLTPEQSASINSEIKKILSNNQIKTYESQFTDIQKLQQQIKKKIEENYLNINSKLIELTGIIQKKQEEEQLNLGKITDKVTTIFGPLQ